MTFDLPIQSVQLHGRRFVIRKISEDKRVYAFKGIFLIIELMPQNIPTAWGLKVLQSSIIYKK